MLLSIYFQIFEDYYLSANFEMVKLLQLLNIVFTVLFVIEMLLRWTANGFVYYFTNIWTVLDFIAVVVSSLFELFSGLRTGYTDACFLFFFLSDTKFQTFL